MAQREENRRVLSLKITRKAQYMTIKKKSLKASLSCGSNKYYKSKNYWERRNFKVHIASPWGHSNA